MLIICEAMYIYKNMHTVNTSFFHEGRIILETCHGKCILMMFNQDFPFLPKYMCAFVSHLLSVWERKPK